MSALRFDWGENRMAEVKRRIEDEGHQGGAPEVGVHLYIVVCMRVCLYKY